MFVFDRFDLTPEPPPGLPFNAALGTAVAALQSGLEAGSVKMIVPPLAGRWNEQAGPQHPFQTEVFFQLQGGCRFTLPGGGIDLRPGDVLPIPNGLPHLETADNYGGRFFVNLVLVTGEERVLFHLATANLKTRLPQIYGRVELCDPGFYLHLTQSLTGWGDDGAEAGEIRRGLLRVLLRKIAADIALGGGVLTTLPPAIASSLARRARALIDADAPRHFPDIAEVARRIGCSPNYLSTLFHREFGFTMKSYVTEAKLRSAAALLAGSDFNIAEIAVRCGFAEPGYFSRVFHKRFGRPPSQTR